MIAIARLTILEAARRRVLWVLAGVTVLSVVLTAWAIGQITSISAREGTSAVEIALGISQVLILAAFMFSFVLAMTAGFLAAPAIGADIESGVAQALLARPIRRADFVLGRWLGLAVVVAGYALAAGLGEIGAVQFASGYGPPDPLGAVVYLAAQAIVLLTFALALSTRLPTIAAGAISIVAFGLGWMAGVLGGVGGYLGVPALTRASDATHVLLPTDLLWRGVVFSLEPPAVILALAGRQARIFEANPFFASSPPEAAAVAWSVGWVVLALGAAVALLRRREI